VKEEEGSRQMYSGWEWEGRGEEVAVAVEGGEAKRIELIGNIEDSVVKNSSLSGLLCL
jgi:hypothetical protein